MQFEIPSNLRLSAEVHFLSNFIWLIGNLFLVDFLVLSCNFLKREEQKLENNNDIVSTSNFHKLRFQFSSCNSKNYNVNHLILLLIIYLILYYIVYIFFFISVNYRVKNLSF